MSLNRSLLRNVSFHDATKPDEVLGGFVQNGSITEETFLDILGILSLRGILCGLKRGYRAISYPEQTYLSKK